MSGIDGLDSTFGGASSKDAADWFYWVDGLLADVGAADYELGGGETVWWDYHRWADAMFAPVAVHAFPAPWAGRPLPVVTDGEFPGLEDWAGRYGLELGPRRGLSDGRPDGGLVVCTPAQAGATSWLAGLLSGDARHTTRLDRRGDAQHPRPRRRAGRDSLRRRSLCPEPRRSRATAPACARRRPRAGRRRCSRR